MWISVFMLGEDKAWELAVTNIFYLVNTSYT